MASRYEVLFLKYTILSLLSLPYCLAAGRITQVMRLLSLRTLLAIIVIVEHRMRAFKKTVSRTLGDSEIHRNVSGNVRTLALTSRFFG